MKNYLDKQSREKKNGKSKNYNTKLSESGRIFKNDLLDSDMTSQQTVRRKLK